MKYDGIIKTDMKCPELVVDANGTELWRDTNIAHEIFKRVKDLLSNEKETKQKIQQAVSVFTAKGRGQISLLVQSTNNGR
ncbi:MAG: hypothetical protein N2691_05370 [Patescibacteria group bacterium]|nr:hypothetical protein [Patescibacteria group bacterium]